MTHEERMERFANAGLYLVTSEAHARGRSTESVVCAALAAGVKLIQLREKTWPLPELVRRAAEVRRLTAAAGALLIVNDRVDVALAVGADGVHLGQDDLPVAEARRLAPDLVIGASAHSLEEARAAEAAGASYVNIGPVYATQTKAWSGAFVGLDEVRRVAASVTIPFTVMGGIGKPQVAELVHAGARVVAVVTAVTAAPDPEDAARDLLAEMAGARAASAGSTARESGAKPDRAPPAEPPAPARRRPHPTLPVALLLDGRPCLVVGGGTIAARKAAALREAGARVTMVAPDIGPDASGMQAAGAVTVHPRPYRPDDLDGRPFLVVTATNDAALNRRILDACHRQGILCACPDHGWEHGDLISPASFRHEDLTISVSTGGASCRRSRLIKESLLRHTEALGDADLLVVGTDHRRTRLALREELHLSGERREAVAGMLRQLLGLHEFMLLDTCNRVELVGLATDAPALADAASRILGFERLRGRFYVHRGFDAFRHLALTVAGLHSQSPGETHIRAQAKAALDESRRAGWSAGILHDWIGRALRIATAVRCATADLLEGREIEDLCVSFLDAELDGLADRRVLVIGGGTIGRGVAERLHARGASVACGYRTHAPAFAGPAAEAIAVFPLGDRPDAALSGRDAVVCASGGGILLDGEQARDLAPGRRLLVADLGVPRNVAPAFSAGRPGIRVANLDDLKRRDRRRAAALRRALAVGDRVVEDHAADYERLRHGIRSGPSLNPRAPSPAGWSS